MDAHPAAATQAVVEPSGGQVVLGPAQHVPLPDHTASVVVGEAVLTMQNDTNKAAIVAEAARLLADRGRYGIHELCLVPDDIDDELVHQIWDDLSRTIHVGARPPTFVHAAADPHHNHAVILRSALQEEMGPD